MFGLMALSCPYCICHRLLDPLHFSPLAIRFFLGAPFCSILQIYIFNFAWCGSRTDSSKSHSLRGSISNSRSICRDGQRYCRTIRRQHCAVNSCLGLPDKHIHHLNQHGYLRTLLDHSLLHFTAPSDDDHKTLLHVHTDASKAQHRCSGCPDHALLGRSPDLFRRYPLWSLAVIDQASVL